MLGMGPAVIIVHYHTWTRGFICIPCFLSHWTSPWETGRALCSLRHIFLELGRAGSSHQISYLEGESKGAALWPTTNWPHDSASLVKAYSDCSCFETLQVTLHKWEVLAGPYPALQIGSSFITDLVMELLVLCSWLLAIPRVYRSHKLSGGLIRAHIVPSPSLLLSCTN